MGLKEILAAKKAAAEAAQQELKQEAKDVLTTHEPEIFVQKLQSFSDKLNKEERDEPVTPAESQANASSPAVQADDKPTQGPAATVSPLDIPNTVAAAPAAESSKEIPITDTSKPLTFAEKMALKKQGIQQAQASPPPVKPATVIDPAMIPENPEDAQAYVDIKQRIDELENLFEDDLKNAMSELKAALKKNPNAAELMLDQDVGKMVIALRKMTHSAQVVAENAPKKGSKKAAKAKDVQLTAEEIAAAFDEL